MSFTFLDLCTRSDADYALLQRRTDACARLGRSYELPCRLPASCIPQDVSLGFYRAGNRYLLYTRPPSRCCGSGEPFAALFGAAPRSFRSFASLTAYLRRLGKLLQKEK